MNNIRVTQTFENSTVPLAMRDEKAYSYGFNGMERDDEVKGSGNSYDFGARIYDPRIAKFLRVDALTKDFPFLTPYQFASNTPIVAVDLDGLEAFFIHGTNNDPNDWATDNPSLMQNLLKLTNNKAVDDQFDWSVQGAHGRPLNWLGNNTSDRQIAAGMLVNYIIDYRTKNDITDEEITLIGFSHGGNVALQAAKMLNKEYGIEVNIVNVNTPAFEEGKGDVEDPQFNEGINDHIHFYTDGDGVAGPISGNDKYKSSTLYTNERQQIKLTPLNSEDGNMINKHYLNNVDPEQASKAKKLTPVNKVKRNP